MRGSKKPSIPLGATLFCSAFLPETLNNEISNIKDRAELEEARAENRRVEIYFDAFIKSKNESVKSF